MRPTGIIFEVTEASEGGYDIRAVTVPWHRDVRVRTLDAITADVAEFLGLSKHDVRETLFG